MIMATIIMDKIAETLKSVKPGKPDQDNVSTYLDQLDQWNDTVKAFGEKMVIGHPAKTHRAIREEFYKLCDADPTNWRI